jgi:hypothetical protein
MPGPRHRLAANDAWLVGYPTRQPAEFGGSMQTSQRSGDGEREREIEGQQDKIILIKKTLFLQIRSDKRYES